MTDSRAALEKQLAELVEKWRLEVHGQYGLIAMGNSADAYVDRCADELAAILSQPEPQDTRQKFEAILERERTKVAECVAAVKDAMHSYSWLIEGRGCYQWDDDDWHNEFAWARDVVLKAIEPMVKIAADLSNCPTKHEEVVKARTDPQDTELRERCCQFIGSSLVNQALIQDQLVTFVQQEIARAQTEGKP